MLPWLALTFTAARLGFEAQNAAVFRLMRLGSRPETDARNHLPRGRIAGGGSTTRGSRTKKALGREGFQETSAGQAATQAVQGALIVRPRRRDSSGRLSAGKAPKPSSPGPEKQ
jgi:hypothetical protein